MWSTGCYACANEAAGLMMMPRVVCVPSTTLLLSPFPSILHDMALMAIASLLLAKCIDGLGKVLVLLHVGGCMVDRLFRIWVWVVRYLAGFWCLLGCDHPLELFFCASCFTCCKPGNLSRIASCHLRNQSSFRLSDWLLDFLLEAAPLSFLDHELGLGHNWEDDRWVRIYRWLWPGSEGGWLRHGGGLCDEADVGVILMPLHPLCSDEFGHFFLRKETDR